MSPQPAHVGVFGSCGTGTLAQSMATLERNVASRMCSAELFQIAGPFRLGQG